MSHPKPPDRSEPAGPSEAAPTSPADPPPEAASAVVARVRLERRVVRVTPLVVIERYRPTPSSVSMNV